MQGFYVNVDYHSNSYTNTLAHGDGSIYDQPTWTATWVQLITTILQAVPQAEGKLLIDLVNEPDGCVRATQHFRPTVGCLLCQSHCSSVLSVGATNDGMTCVTSPS